ncbi:acetyl-CoA synthetase-like protein [Pleomassaria siparia CBS 279.74]|uniref:Acetyl-CoA synthetase-like protein n=1 Tax=Pleomassaria siparia CBS 279.74 TaxID=1314801 RepID=A0A6G1K9U3_9PLEO|nr:acetyl-CoA synthetase-like protein [Pleomassaria siparia CBS 279.74]
MEDRTFMLPKHAGYHVLPNTPLFSRLLRFASRKPARIAIDDVRSNHQRTHLELLSDVLALRETILNTLDPATIEALERRDEVYLAIVAAGGYEYTVAMLAVLALGAAAVPITPALPVEEATYFVEKSKAALVLASSRDLEKCCRLEKRIVSTSNEHFRGVAIGPYTLTPILSPTDILISSDRALEENAPGVVIFTSADLLCPHCKGTTGPPKGAVMRRSFVFDCALSVADHYRIKEDDVMLHVLPVHHATGVGINFFPFLISGSRIEFRSGGFDEAWMWERWMQGAINPRRRLTFFSGVPTIYMRMRRHYQRTLSKLPSKERAKYIAGARQFRACLCGTSALPQPLNEFWTTLMQKKIIQRYGATEFGAVFKVRLDDKKAPDGSVGELVNGVDIKLSEGEEGEVLVKSPHMFSKYLYDPEATAKAHDEDGYFRTGDIARREGNYYWIVGRASLDIIKSGGYKISALDIERELLSLPYVAEAMVVGVADEEFGQRVAALISLQEEDLTDAFLETYGNGEYILTIADLRRDLRERLAGYKIPTLLRIVEGELPKTVTGKVQKKILGQRFFPDNYQMCAEVQQWASPSMLAKL